MQEMAALRVSPNLETYELLLTARAAAGDAAGAQAALREAAKAGIQLAPTTWMKAMKAFGAAGDLEVTKKAAVLCGYACSCMCSCICLPNECRRCVLACVLACCLPASRPPAGVGKVPK